ncbi:MULTISPECIES: hypothetical protein [Mycobacteriaceae]|uniref:hypothetical protein n=1 Tax=Mycobacteriaceae TaxID=1762 RepID=UPI000268246A|nr:MULTISPECIES: hypothetical protein [Mycobacteriaceae]EIU51607.1 hypothetical protein MA6G0125S_5319 [Mycobacteroides abscessus 6G-0125-S]EIU64274.1 hypothetical protein MA6G0728S_5415 [Mycobacteroides abscessus 6G-0728-S]EIU74698.1 hypothetical protein MA6G1108_5322 [Mycobacteroides abscessus 6G-1108]EIV03138.1 hypothetical protein MA6G0728R_5442 [Mycobacteroides abscessus 6G-0728-R]
MNTNFSEWHLPPWTDDEVANINDFQRSGAMHPLTCGCGPQDDGDFFDWPNRVRVAHSDGLHCPNGRCSVQTTHVDRGIADGSLLRSIQQDRSDAMSAANTAPQQDDWDF